MLVALERLVLLPHHIDQLFRLEHPAPGSGFRVSGFGFRVHPEPRISGSGFRELPESGSGVHLKNPWYNPRYFAPLQVSQDQKGSFFFRTIWISFFGPNTPDLNPDAGYQVSGFGFRVSCIRFRVSGFGFRVSSFGFRVPGTPRA